MRSRRVHQALLPERQRVIAVTKALIEGVWERERSCCQECGRAVSRPGTSLSHAGTGYVYPATDMASARLLCGPHFQAVGR